MARLRGGGGKGPGHYGNKLLFLNLFFPTFQNFNSHLLELMSHLLELMSPLLELMSHLLELMSPLLELMSHLLDECLLCFS